MCVLAAAHHSSSVGLRASPKYRICRVPAFFTEQMECYPTKEEVADGEETMCQVCKCPLANFTSLVNHLRKAHGFTKDTMKGSWVHTEYMKERRPAMLGVGEASFVSLCFSSPGVVDESKYMCLVCSKPFAKLKCAEHMKKHNVSKEDLATWCAPKDGNTIRWAAKQGKDNSYGESHLLLTRAMLGASAAAPDGNSDAGDCPADTGGASSGHAEDQSCNGDPDGEQGTAVFPDKQLAGTITDSAPPTLWRRAFVRVDESGNFMQPLAVKMELPTGGAEWLQPAKQPIGDAPNEVLAAQSAPDSSQPAPGGPRQKVSASKKALALLEQAMGVGWEKAIPAVRLKHEASSVELPAAKGDGDAMRADRFEKAHPVQPMPLSSFQSYLASMKVNQGAQIGDHLRGMSRFFSLIEVESNDGAWGAIDTEELACDPLTLIGCLQSKVHEVLFDLPLLDFNKYTWGGKLLEAVMAFCRWHIHELNGQLVAGGIGPWTQHKAAIDRLLTILQGGYHKRWMAAKDKKVIAKNREDLDRIKALPPVAVLRGAVEKGYLDLAAIHKEYAHDQCTPLPRNVQGLANASMVGAFWLDMFGGRKSEVENTSLAEVDRMLAEGRDYLVCPEHKTSRTYGSLAKWLTPGVLQAVKVYRELPRRPGVKTFLVPACEGTDTVSIPQAFATFCAQKLKNGSRPTVNIMRKFFHKQLMEATKDEVALKQVMVVLDGHAVTTIDRHYALREPADDVALAKLLVKWVLGDKTAVFPTRCHANHLTADLLASFSAAEAMPEVQEDTSADDDELAWWWVGDFFGVNKPLMALADKVPSFEPLESPAKKARHSELVPLPPSMPASSSSGASPSAVVPAAAIEPTQTKEIAKPKGGPGKPSKVSPEGKAFLISRQESFCTRDTAPAPFLKQWLEEGITKGALGPETTLEQIRQVCKYWVEQQKQLCTPSK
jgi:hypothetical protein